MTEKNLEVLISEAEIQRRVQELADEISRDYAGEGNKTRVSMPWAACGPGMAPCSMASRSAPWDRYPGTTPARGS